MDVFGIVEQAREELAEEAAYKEAQREWDAYRAAVEEAKAKLRMDKVLDLTSRYKFFLYLLNGKGWRDMQCAEWRTIYGTHRHQEG